METICTMAGYYPTIATPQRAPLGFDTNHLYLSPSQQQTSRPGIFLKRNEKLDWRRIAAVDVDRISREMDFAALQDNLEQITLCNIDAEIDSRAMDPNFVKLYKMAQLTIEYLLLCQDQITTQLVDYEQLKNKGSFDHEEARRHIEKLKTELADTKKESKKRRKMLETQQRMLMAQNSNYHTCPVCTHAFLSQVYLQQHMQRRHPEYDPTRRREHDVDVEKEIQRLKDELNKKEMELQLIKVQKTVDEEKIRDRDANIRQLKEEIQTLTAKITILDDRFSQMRSNTQTRSPSPHRHEAGISELLKENKNLRADIEQLKQLLQQAEHNLKTEGKLKRQYERDNEKLLREIANLKENLQLLQNTSGDKNQLTQDLINFKNQYNEERLRRKKFQEELQEANNQLAQLRNQPPPVTNRKSPVPPPPPHSSGSPVQEPVKTRPVRPVQTTGILLPEHCTSLVRRLNDNPKYLTKYRDEAKNLFVEDLEDAGNLGILETDTRLGELDYRTKMEHVLQTRHSIGRDLSDFERIRADLSQKLDKLATERLDPQRSGTSIRSGASKLVTFEDQRQRQRNTDPIHENTAKISTDQRRIQTTVQAKPKYDHSRPAPTVHTSITNNESDEDVTISNANESDDDEDTQPTRPGIVTGIQPSPRKNVPPSKTTTGVSSLVAGSMRPSTAKGSTTVSATTRQPIVKPTSTMNKFNSDSESESQSSVPPYPTNGVHSSNTTEKTRIIERKLKEADAKGQKPGINAIAQGFRPSHQSVTAQSDDDDSESLTTLHTTNAPPKAPNGHLPQISGRESMNNHPLSSGDVSQHTYDSLWKSQVGKGVDFRRPATADSAKTSNLDSDDNSDGEESN